MLFYSIYLQIDRCMSIKIHEFKTQDERRSYVEQTTKADLSVVEKAFVDEENIQNVHCENLIGAISIPLGVAGPLTVNSDDVQHTYYVPLATSEGALVASVSRGMKAVSEAGGASVWAFKAGTTRAPVFFTGSLEKSFELKTWILAQADVFNDIAQTTSGHINILRSEIKIVGSYLFLRLFFDTDDAMGMNMVTIASQKIVDFITEQTGYECTAVSGNYCVDKKPSWLTFIDGRGIQVFSEVFLSAETIQNVLKTNAQAMFQTWLSKCVYGSIMSGSIGFNCHFANVTAAFYLATGQDAAHVVEGSHGILTADLTEDGGLHLTTYQPSVLLGTVGGGTKLSTQSACLTMLGVNSSLELARVLGGSVLAAEISLLASLSVGSLAVSHKKLGR